MPLAKSIGDKLRLSFICQVFFMNFSKALDLLLLLMFVAFSPIAQWTANIQFSVYFSRRSLWEQSDRRKARNLKSKTNQAIGDLTTICNTILTNSP